jgi:hypothetical protein
MPTKCRAVYGRCAEWPSPNAPTFVAQQRRWTPRHFSALGLAAAAERVTPQAVAARLRVTPTAAQQLLCDLEAAALLSRDPVQWA